ncbi:unnamed protein product [Hymenolepis diminuta]|uniref:Uncharacterized protein n=1 Tax=Hymenolepis diminuta TaxID=6216 RepID=A0A0R3SGJ0_HYMDI|nr:unnamed protein product [Hymenolepis diminuta]VUZ51094.1 unnamed protein product [Hymenolepis diminuta]
MVLATLSLVVRDVSSSRDIITMDEFVDTFTDTLISWNDRPTESLGRDRRSTDTSTHSTQQSEYVNVDCNLVCRIEVNTYGPHQNVLVCRPKSKDIQRKGTLARTICVEHASGRLLHMIISIPNNSADHLDRGFAEAVSNALQGMNPEPETLYLTIEIPLSALRQDDFTALAPKLRRLSISSGLATQIDRYILSSLSLESYSFEGCHFKDTRVFHNESGLCDVNMLYTCPKIGDFILAADRIGWKKLCPEKSNNLALKVQPNPLSDSRCGADYQSLIEALHLSRKDYPSHECAQDSDYRQLFLLSLITNLILTCILLVITLFSVVFYVQNNQRSHRNKAQVEWKTGC